MRHLERSLIHLMDVATAALTERSIATNIEPVLAALLTVMDADVAGLYWHDLSGASWPVMILPPEALRAIPTEHREPHPTAIGAAMHPGWRVCLQGPTVPFRVSDVVSDLTWRASPVADALRPHWGVHHQFAIPIYSTANPTTFWVWVLARQGHDFTESHRDLARRVRPVLARITHFYAAANVQHAVLDQAGGLTKRELLVFELVARDHTAGQIARQLEISPRTVNKHLENIYRKLGVHDRFHALERAPHHLQRGRSLP
jgi:DNA-binding CsgD family transcriptional regulator